MSKLYAYAVLVIVMVPNGFTHEIGWFVVKVGKAGAFGGALIIAIVAGEIHPVAEFFAAAADPR